MSKNKLSHRFMTLFFLIFALLVLEQSIVFASIAFRINAGDTTNYTDNQGNLWSKDKEYLTGSYGYVGGRTYRTSDPIYNTEDDSLYQSCRYNLIAYRFDLPNDIYQVRLLVSEIYYRGENIRLMGVRIEDVPILNNLDIYSTVGHDAALQIVSTAHVTDGRLDIDFSSIKNYALISAIEVMSQDYPQSAFAYRINAGYATDYVDSQGYTWIADRPYAPGGYGYVGGNIYATSHPISNTNDDPLYQSCRWALTAYRFDVPNGVYSIRLLFSEIWFGGRNSRLFSVRIEDAPILKSLDIGAIVGHDAALQIAHIAHVTDGRLDIDFSPSLNNTVISAIEVMRLDSSLPVHWSFKQTGNNATVVLPTTANPNINGSPLTPNDYVGVFTSAGLCCGYGQWQGQNLALTVWGDDDQTPEVDGFQAGEVLNYRVYRIAEQKELTAITVAYSQGDGRYSVNGYMVLSQFDVADSIKTMTLNFDQGWNLFSINVIPDHLNMDTVMSPIRDKVLIIKNDSGLNYIPEFHINQIGDLNYKESYLACLKQTATLKIRGKAVDPSTPIALPAGWSMISYLPDTPMNIDSALASIIGHLIMAKDGAGRVYIPAFNINQIGKMYPGQGYWVRLSTADTLVYPSGNFIVEKMLAEKTECHCLSSTVTDHFQFTSSTGENATIVITTDTHPRYTDGTPLQDGDEIGVFTTQGLCCGAIVWEGVNTAITVWGDNSQTDSLDGFKAGDTLRVRVWKKSADGEYLTTVSYRTGDPSVYQANGFSVFTELTADLSRQYTSVEMETGNQPDDFRLVQNHPNPFNPETSISYQVPKTSHIRIEVFNLLGQQIRTLLEEEKNPGNYQILWNGLDDQGQPVRSGVYLCRMQAGDFSTIKKMVLVR